MLYRYMYVSWCRRCVSRKQPSRHLPSAVCLLEWVDRVRPNTVSSGALLPGPFKAEEVQRQAAAAGWWMGWTFPVGNCAWVS